MMAAYSALALANQTPEGPEMDSYETGWDYYLDVVTLRQMVFEDPLTDADVIGAGGAPRDIRLATPVPQPWNGLLAPWQPPAGDDFPVPLFVPCGAHHRFMHVLLGCAGGRRIASPCAGGVREDRGVLTINTAVPGLGLLRSAFGTLAVPGLRDALLARVAGAGGLPVLKRSCLHVIKITDVQPGLVEKVIHHHERGREGPAGVNFSARVRYVDVAPRDLDAEPEGTPLPMAITHAAAQTAKRCGGTHLPACMTAMLPSNAYDREDGIAGAIRRFPPRPPSGIPYGDLFPARRGGTRGATADVLAQRVKDANDLTVAVVDDTFTALAIGANEMRTHAEQERQDTGCETGPSIPTFPVPLDVLLFEVPGC
jgi:hypothetical protein